eukprot:CAMPEP_0168185616 /NCGR_PEP_ID=MMETSP0139_2-20121125/13950_1 /TAXON_ID=44445 /ORGANISM="Pseudo-nitzschia australis, Strain 10249 10 AB" /LENGTH=82 /DNA_ID=CAMNT_0008107481 /DNA_START=889 /DNA_END=1137 /DNA_ORIENTATION=-
MTAPLPTPEPDPAAAPSAATNATTVVAAPAATHTPPTPSKTHLVPNPTLPTSPSKPVATVQQRFHYHLIHDAYSKKKKTKKK